jgi:diguanylate cyclase (GGDEF)-like protein
MPIFRLKGSLRKTIRPPIARFSRFPRTLMTPVEIARQALHRLAELALAPTPENYEAQYRSIAGLLPKEPLRLASADQTLLEMLRALVGTISQANEGLQADLTRFSNESSTLLAQAEHGSDAGAGTEMLKTMTASASWLLAQVEASRKELEGTRAQLNRAQDELERAQSLALSDPLTTLPNRRGLDVALSRELARARRAHTPLCLAVLDIDHFKRINDQFGHAVGDQALQHVASVLKQAVRETDILARFGGEEFVLLFPDTLLPAAEFTLNRLLRTLERAPLEANDTQVAVCFSAGLAQWGPQESAEHLVTRADQAMYAAKRAGRGRVMVAEAEQAA